MSEPTPEDRERLIEFVVETLELLRRLISEGRDPQGRRLIDPELLPLFHDAWNEFDEQFSMHRAAAAIRETPAPRLVWAGLYGAQLSLKLAVIDRFRRSFMSFGGGRWIKKLLDAIDRVLDSLIAATGLDEALKELKDIISDSVEEE